MAEPAQAASLVQHQRAAWVAGEREVRRGRVVLPQGEGMLVFVRTNRFQLAAPEPSMFAVPHEYAAFEQKFEGSVPPPRTNVALTLA